MLTKLDQHCGVEARSEGRLYSGGSSDNEMGHRCVGGSAQEDPRRTLLEEGGTAPDPNTAM